MNRAASRWRRETERERGWHGRIANSSYCNDKYASWESQCDHYCNLRMLPKEKLSNYCPLGFLPFHTTMMVLRLEISRLEIITLEMRVITLHWNETWKRPPRFIVCSSSRYEAISRHKGTTFERAIHWREILFKFKFSNGCRPRNVADGIIINCTTAQH